MKTFRSPFLHLILFSCIPLLTIYGHNVREVAFFGVIRPLIVSMLFVFIIFLFALIIFRNKSTSALITSMVVILFFSYGHLQTGLLLTKTIFVQLGRNWVLIPIYLIVFIVSILTIIKKWVNLIVLHQLLNIIALTLIIFPAVQILGYHSISAVNSKNNDLSTSMDVNTPGNKRTPDIYYIILDSYTRQDELMQRYGFDNSAFISELKDIGFYTADCSFTNYPYTSGSMAATLNMDYLYNTTTEPEDSGDQDPIYRLIQKNRVREILENPRDIKLWPSIPALRLHG